MPMALAVKCSLLAFDAVVLYAALSPPTDAPTNQERVSLRFIEYLGSGSRIGAHGVPILHKTTFALCCLAEIAVNLAYRYPKLPFSHLIIHALTFRGAYRPSPQLTAPFLVGSALVAAGSLLRLWCFHIMGRNFSFELAIRKDHRLVTSGPYSIVRHPSYTGWFVLIVGAMVAQWNDRHAWIRASGFAHTVLGRAVIGYWVAMLPLGTVILVSRMKAEDKCLQATFGERWIDWCQKVKYKLVPWLY